MMFGQEIRLPFDLSFGQPERESDEQMYGSQYANELRDKLDEANENSE